MSDLTTEQREMIARVKRDEGPAWDGSGPVLPGWLTVLFRCEVGSTVHGCGIDDQDDRDEMGIAVPPPDRVIGLRPFEQFQWRTQPDGVRSGPGDLDLVIYSARKWMRLVLAGNPTVLLPLFVPDDAVMWTTPLFDDLRANREKFIGRHVAGRYLGYMNSQLAQLTGERSRKHTNRPELVAKFGFDTKFAYHAVRLGHQGITLLTTGDMDVPIRQPYRDRLRAIRRGETPLADVLEWAGYLQGQLAVLKEGKGLPQGPDHAWADAWLIRAHTRVWQMRERAEFREILASVKA